MIHTKIYKTVQENKSGDVNATKSYLHFSHSTGDAILCSNFFRFLYRFQVSCFFYKKYMYLLNASSDLK